MRVLDGRKTAILRAVIEDHIQTADPVGSETLAHRLRLGVSPATIRNEMAALEEMGYLSQPHTSAGRVPTDRGYRLYVDAVLMEARLTPQERARVTRPVPVAEGPGRMAEAAARTLASVTEYASVVAPPRTDHLLFKHVHFIPFGSTRVMAVIVTNAGVTEGKMLDLGEGLDPDDLDRLSRMVSRRLEGHRLDEITDALLAEVVHEAAWQQRAVRELAAWLHRYLPMVQRRVFIDGAANILKQPEFQDIRTAQPVLLALQQEEIFSDLLGGSSGRAVWITIGTENPHEVLHACSVVAATYGPHDMPVGALAILGPTRMKYGKVIAMVRYLAHSLSQALGDAV
ncbi:MAG TPA: heat-inducible transcriptional repressor HrcA [bacterium]|jgi:heat-inducible transcriptional repressor|nr:heat-inducible transcriptional repressor HrcA [bacterium]